MKSKIYRQISRRFRQLSHTWQTEGPRWIIDRTRTVAANWIKPKTELPPVEPAQVISANLTDAPQRHSMPLSANDRILINWVMSPPSAGSGGQTTIFRFINYLESNGYKNSVYYHDPYRGDHAYYASIARDYFGFTGFVGRVEDVMADAHAVIATSWPTAYAVYNSHCRGKRYYFVQDFEPSFYPASSDSIFAENTYRMDFHAITAGRWLAEKLNDEYRMQTDHFNFGCDTVHYKRLPDHRRCGVAFYARPSATRRGFELGIMALELFAKRRPDMEIHIYGDKLGRLSFPFINHGLVTPGKLNEIYNLCYAGLSLSLTNVSLVPYEMLAAGCIPVMNDAVHNKMVLDNPFVRYAPTSPHDLAAELETVVSTPDFDSLSRTAAESVKSSTWDQAGKSVDLILRRSLSAQSPENASAPAPHVSLQAIASASSSRS